MAYQLPTYTTESGITVTDAYLRVIDVRVEHVEATATVAYSIFVSQAAADAGTAPIHSEGYAFDSTLYAPTFAAALGTSPLTVPTTVDDILWTQAYLAMKQHPSLTTLLTGATAV